MHYPHNLQKMNKNNKSGAQHITTIDTDRSLGFSPYIQSSSGAISYSLG